MYAEARDESLEPLERWHRFQNQRNDLFRSHPQSALTEADRPGFVSLTYFPYDPSLRFLLPVDTEVDPGEIRVELEQDGVTRLRRFGRIAFEIDSQPASLSLFWVEGYGGGIFLPFGDETNGEETYGGGRYLLDTIKGADLGEVGGRMVIDFNFAYNPSCAYNPFWSCPLAPAENRLPLPIRAGELDYRALDPQRG